MRRIGTDAAWLGEHRLELLRTRETSVAVVTGTTSRTERQLSCTLPLRVVIPYVQKAWLNRLRSQPHKQSMVKSVECGPIVRNGLMTAVVAMMLNGVDISQEFADQVNDQLGDSFLPLALEELLDVLCEMGVDTTAIATVEDATGLELKTGESSDTTSERQEL